MESKISHACFVDMSIKCQFKVRETRPNSHRRTYRLSYICRFLITSVAPHKTVRDGEHSSNALGYTGININLKILVEAINRATFHRGTERVVHRYIFAFSYNTSC